MIFHDIYKGNSKLLIRYCIVILNYSFDIIILYYYYIILLYYIISLSHTSHISL